MTDRDSRNDASPHHRGDFTKRRELILPVVAAVGAVVALLLLAASGFGTRFGLWHFRTGFSILKFAGYLGVIFAILAILAALLSARNKHYTALLVSLGALVAANLAFGVPYSWKVKAERYPRIHDISTDLDNPPKFIALAPARGERAAYPGAAVAAQQLQAYPDLKTLVLSIPRDGAFQSALDVAHEMGWAVIASVPAEGRIEATDTTKWFGFNDDIVIRIFPAGERSLVDIRSASRVGISDVGTNAHRIRTFLAKLNHQQK